MVSRQAPWPSQLGWTATLPEQNPTPHEVPGAYRAQPPLPSQRPSCPQPNAPSEGQTPRGSRRPAWAEAQTPSAPPVAVAEQAWHRSVQASWQQIPSTQKPDWHWEGEAQASPFVRLGKQASFAQYAAGTHCASFAQVVAHADGVAHR
jgi:hypothetical protein